MAADDSATIAELRTEVQQFVDDRDWNQFHAPKNLAMALAIEAAELMEHFQWIGVDESRALVDDTARVQAIGEEVADVFCYTLAMANALGLDLTETFRAKMQKNARKYPVEEIRGRWGHADPNAASSHSAPTDASPTNDKAKDDE